jgi:predicted MFS family arabinose efflux permease
VPLVVHLLGLTIFTLTTAEFMVAGMMPALAAAFGVGVGAIGFLISLYALGMALGGPVLTALLLARRTPPRQALLRLLGFYVVGAVAATLAPGYAAMAVARFAMGVASAACFGVALNLCAGLVAPEARGRAASIVLGGLMFAPVLGLPVTSLVEQHFGWRASFGAVAVLSMVCTAIVARFVPATGSGETPSLAAEVRALSNGPLWAAYATSGLVIGATFAAFSYSAPILIGVTGLPASAMPGLLAAYGAANVVGNVMVGRLADRHTLAVLAGGLGLLTLALVAFASFAQHPVVGIGAFLVIGLTGVALNPALVARVMRLAPPGALVNTLHASVITAGLAFGTWAGGAGIDHGHGLRAPLWVGAALALLGLASLAPSLARSRRTAPAAGPRTSRC